MDLETILENFDAIVELPNGIEQVRSRIIDLAISGKLVLQNINDSSVLEILNEKKKEVFSKQLNIKQETLKEFIEINSKHRPQIPNSWGYISAIELLKHKIFIGIQDGNHRELHPKRAEFTDQGIPFIASAQVNNFKIDYKNANKLNGIALKRIKEGFAKKGDVVYTHKGTIGRVAIVEQDCILTPQTTYYRACPEIILPKYLMWYLYSSQFTRQVELVKSHTARCDFIPITYQHLLFHVIPPLAEQERIVKKLDEIMTRCDRAQQAKQARDELYKKLASTKILA